ncbi:hypothetical protein TL16_g12168 [Triparma laevis f. inornata]|uniref:Uncharacterized protein n=1 Tax=Triparma laevis f. inornata TaxID=1714386 RepID=A0A9W7EVM9_9STRA|nr:hypothetical protein TL16_g12168 [Triparma laevis f. inornata]
MSNAVKGAVVVSKPHSRNQTIIEGREANLKGQVEHKKEELKALAKRIKELNRNNAKKDEMIEDVERTMYDLIEKHTASLEMLETEHSNASDDTSHELSVLQADVNHLKWQVDRANEMEAQNISLLEERDMLMLQLGASENQQHDAVTNIKKEILKQEEKLEKQFKKELVMMDAKYRQIAFEGLHDSKKKALLENSKLQEEIVMQKIGLVNLGERMLVEDEQLQELHKMKKLYEQQTAECSNRIAVLRRGSYAYDARMADMDVTLQRLTGEEQVQSMKLGSFVMSLGDTNRETERLKEKEKRAKGEAMKWKSSMEIDAELPPGPSRDMEGNKWTFEMTKGIQAKNEIGSEEFVGLWGEILRNWQEEDGDDALRLDIAATGLVKKPLGRLGSSSLLNGGERFDLSGGLRGVSEPPRKRLIGSLKRYHDPRESLKFRKETKQLLKMEKRGKGGKKKKGMEVQSLW